MFVFFSFFLSFFISALVANKRVYLAICPIDCWADC